MRNLLLIPMCLFSMAVLAACAENQPATAEEGKPSPHRGQVLADVPDLPDPGDHFLIYLHGAIVETEGMRPTHPRFGVYEYAQVLETFADRGFVVVSEVRPPKTHPDAYARRVVTQVQTLVDAGVPQPQITVVGFSKGGIITALASSKIALPEVNWVILAGCGGWVDRLSAMVPNGRVLSILDGADDLATTCEPLLVRMPEGSTYEELTLTLGTGHGAFYSPDPAWVEPTIEWAGR